MLKKQVALEQSYTAKIGDKLTVVTLKRVNRFGGWDAINEATGRSIRIKSAQKLRAVASGTQLQLARSILAAKSR